MERVSKTIQASLQHSAVSRTPSFVAVLHADLNLTRVLRIKLGFRNRSELLDPLWIISAYPTLLEISQYILYQISAIDGQVCHLITEEARRKF